MPGIGLNVISAPRDGVTLLKFLVDVASGKGGKIVDDLIAAEAKLAKMEEDANKRLDQRESELESIKQVNDQAMQAHIDDANKVKEAAIEEVRKARAELAVDVARENAVLDKRDAEIKVTQEQVLAIAKEADKKLAEAENRMLAAKELNAKASAVLARYEAWEAKVSSLKV